MRFASGLFPQLNGAQSPDGPFAAAPLTLVSLTVHGRLLRASRPTVGYCVRPARGSATACVPPDGRLLRASRTTVPGFVR
jgi:hypothetical protein